MNSQDAGWEASIRIHLVRRSRVVRTATTAVLVPVLALDIGLLDRTGPTVLADLAAVAVLDVVPRKISEARSLARAVAETLTAAAFEGAVAVLVATDVAEEAVVAEVAAVVVAAVGVVVHVEVVVVEVAEGAAAVAAAQHREEAKVELPTEATATCTWAGLATWQQRVPYERFFILLVFSFGRARFLSTPRTNLADLRL